jgi:hypothetical protein
VCQSGTSRHPGPHLKHTGPELRVGWVLEVEDEGPKPGLVLLAQPVCRGQEARQNTTYSPRAAHNHYNVAGLLTIGHASHQMHHTKPSPQQRPALRGCRVQPGAGSLHAEARPTTPAHSATGACTCYPCTAQSCRWHMCTCQLLQVQPPYLQCCSQLVPGTPPHVLLTGLELCSLHPVCHVTTSM